MGDDSWSFNYTAALQGRRNKIKGISKAKFYTLKVRGLLLALVAVRAATKVQICSHAKERKKLIRKWKRNTQRGTTAALMSQVKNRSITSHILLSPETLTLSFSSHARSDGSSISSPFPHFCSEKQRFIFIFISITTSMFTDLQTLARQLLLRNCTPTLLPSLTFKKF